MKKELLFAAEQSTAPATVNNGIGNMYARFTLHTRQLRLLFSTVLLLIVTQSTGWANNNLSAAVNPSPQSFLSTSRHYLMTEYGLTDIAIPFRPISNKAQSLTDVTLLFTNSFGNDFDVYLYNTVTEVYYDINVNPNSYQKPLTVPEGTYDVFFYPNDMGIYHHYYSFSCGSSGGGIGTKSFYGENISSAIYCNSIFIE